MYKGSSRFVQGHPELMEPSAGKRRSEVGDRLSPRYFVLIFHERRDNQGVLKVFRTLLKKFKQKEAEDKLLSKGYVQVFRKGEDGSFVLLGKTGREELRTRWEGQYPDKGSGPEHGYF